MTQAESLDKMKLKELVALAESMQLTHLAGKNKAQLREYILQNQRAGGSEQKTEPSESTEPPTKKRGRRAKGTKVVETPVVETPPTEVAPEAAPVEETPAPKKRGRRSKKVEAVEEAAAPQPAVENTVVEEPAEPQVAQAPVKPKRKYVRRRKTQDASVEASAQQVETPSPVQEPTPAAPEPETQNASEPATPEPASEEAAPVVKKRRRYTRRKTEQVDSAPSLLDVVASAEPTETPEPVAAPEPTETQEPVAAPEPNEAQPKRRRRTRVAKPAVEGAPKSSRRSRKVDVASKDVTAIHAAPPVKDARRKLAKTESGSYAAKEVEEYLRLSVCGPFWLLAQWKLAEKSVNRVRSAMGRRWHTSTPQARVYRIDRDPLVSVFRRVHVSSVPIVPDVESWYLPVEDPPSSFMVELGYEARDGEFFTVSSSNIVDTPPRFMQEYQAAPPFFAVGTSFDRAFQQNNFTGRRGGLVFGSDEELAGAFVDGSTFSRLMGEPAFPEPKELRMSVEAEVVIKGRVSEGATVLVRDEPTPVNKDGEFAIRAPLPERRHLFPVVATNLETLETQTIVVSIERNTKVLDRVIRGEEE